jgi:hypothetical protein
LILSDISTIYLAKRTLTLASEAAAQRGVKNLDQEAYYSGEYNLTRAAQNLFGSAEEDPGIPIDCDAGERDSAEVLAHWQGRKKSIIRSGIAHIEMTDFSCDGFQIYLTSSAIVKMPFPIPFIDINEVEIKGSAGAIGERGDTNNFYGFDIG